jgi:hypothetical protein
MDASSAVLPTVRAEGERLHLAYYLARHTGSAVVVFVGVSRWSYGPPNDEALASHPLWGSGLQFYEFHIVGPPSADGRRHWVATFHDGTFEIEAAEVHVVSTDAPNLSPSLALDRALGRGTNRVLDDER